MSSPLGQLRISEADGAISEVAFTDETASIPDSTNSILNEAQHQLQRYFDGTLEKFDLPLGPTGTDFQQRVWHELQDVPFGKTATYLDIALRLGDEKVIRAAAAANGKNPIAIIIPCHRVIGSNGDLVGYAGGLDRKKWLLKHEGSIQQLDIFET